MPVKNAGDFLSPCLDSILNQSIEDWELIAINDGSTDESESILQEYVDKDPRIRLQTNAGHGIIDALRQAYTLSTGVYITRMDADDLMYPHKLEILSKQLTQHGEGHLSIGNVEYISETTLGDGYKKYADWLNALTKQGSNWSDIYKECVIPSPCWMIHRRDLEGCGSFKSDIYPEDYDLCFRFYKAGLRCIPSQEIIHQWRDHKSRTSRTSEVYRDNRFLDLKLSYFLAIDHNPESKLVLWGAGKKGKLVAQFLLGHGIHFDWISNNPNKIGHTIYTKTITAQDTTTLHTEKQFLIAIGNPTEQEAIYTLLNDSGLIRGEHFFPLS